MKKLIRSLLNLFISAKPVKAKSAYVDKPKRTRTFKVYEKKWGVEKPVFLSEEKHILNVSKIYPMLKASTMYRHFRENECQRTYQKGSLLVVETIS